jgi:hypothetical protein
MVKILPPAVKKRSYYFEKCYKRGPSQKKCIRAARNVERVIFLAGAVHHVYEVGDILVAVVSPAAAHEDLSHRWSWQQTDVRSLLTCESRCSWRASAPCRSSSNYICPISALYCLNQELSESHSTLGRYTSKWRKLPYFCTDNKLAVCAFVIGRIV